MGFWGFREQCVGVSVFMGDVLRSVTYCYDNYKTYVQQSMLRLETIFGKIKYKFGKGAISTSIINKLNA